MHSSFVLEAQEKHILFFDAKKNFPEQVERIKVLFIPPCNKYE
jgi:hypothetical protein